MHVIHGLRVDFGLMIDEPGDELHVVNKGRPVQRRSALIVSRVHQRQVALQKAKRLIAMAAEDRLQSEPVEKRPPVPALPPPPVAGQAAVSPLRAALQSNAQRGLHSRPCTKLPCSGLEVFGSSLISWLVSELARWLKCSRLCLIPFATITRHTLMFLFVLHGFANTIRF